MGPSILRLSRFRPLQPSFDAALRDELIPRLLEHAGLRAVLAARAGFDLDGPRLVATVWGASDAMDAALGEDRLRPAGDPLLLEAITDLEVEAWPIAIAFPPERPAEIGIARLLMGRTRPGMLAAYLEEAQRGTQADRDAGGGPQALYLGAAAPERFVTLSLWDSWTHLEAATGASYADVSRTRHAELLESWTAEHFEVVPGTMAVVRDVHEAQPA